MILDRCDAVIIGGGPEVFCRDGVFYLYYWRSVPGKKGFQIHYATSRDGYRFAEPVPSLALPVGPAGSWDSFTVETPRIFKEGDLYYMVYCGSDPGGLKKGIHHCSITQLPNDPKTGFLLTLCSAVYAWQGQPFINDTSTFKLTIEDATPESQGQLH